MAKYDVDEAERSVLKRCSVLQRRRYVEYNNDPQRRCYNGAHFSTAFRWDPWEVLERFDVGTDLAKIEKQLAFWRELNEYAVKSRGVSAKCEFRVVPEESDQVL